MIRDNKSDSQTRQQENPDNFTTALRKSDERAGIIQAFLSFIKPIWQVVLFGFLLGILLVIVGELGGGVHTVDKELYNKFFWMSVAFLTMREIGMGLIVAAIAVFGYEYTHRVRGDFERQLEQKATLVSLDDAVGKLQITGKLKDFTKILTEEMDTNLLKSINRSGGQILDKMFSNEMPAEREFKRIIRSLINQAQIIKGTDTIYCQSYLELINWLCQNVIHQNATSLAGLERHTVRPLGLATGNFNLPTNKSIASRLFGLQLKNLDEGDLYKTISNVLFWEGKDLAFFLHETHEACLKRKVEIHRLFNLTNFIESDLLLKDKFEQAKDIINEKHKKLEEDSKGLYKIRFLTKIQKSKALNKLPYNENRTRPLYSIGIFTHNDKEKDSIDQVSFEARNEQLSNIIFTRDMANIQDYLEIFEMMWKVSANVINPFEGDIDYFKQVVSQEYDYPNTPD